MDSLGYDGTIREDQLARYLQAATGYVVESAGAWKPTALAGQRSVLFAAGEVFGAGILDPLVDATVVDLPNPGSGGRWHLIVAHRDWTANSTEIISLAGAATGSTVPTARPTVFPVEFREDFGEVADQPICWAWVNTTNNNVVLFDLRRVRVTARASGTSVTGRHRTANLNINNGAGAALIDYNAATSTPADPDFSYSAGQFTALRAGDFAVIANLNMETAGRAVGYQLTLRKNGFAVANRYSLTSTSGQTSLSIAHTISLAPGDSISAFVFAAIAAPGVGAVEGAADTYIQITRQEA